MKKSIILLLALFVFVITGFNTTVNSAEQGYISVEATSQLDIVPDVIDFSVEVVSTSKDSMAKAIAENKKISGKVYEDIKKNLDKNNGDSIKTSNFNTTPVYRYNNNKCSRYK